MERRVNKPSALPSPLPFDTETLRLTTETTNRHNVVIHAERNTTPQHIIVERHTWPAKEAISRMIQETSIIDLSPTETGNFEDPLLYILSLRTNDTYAAHQPLRTYKRRYDIFNERRCCREQRVRTNGCAELLGYLTTRHHADLKG